MTIERMSFSKGHPVETPMEINGIIIQKKDQFSPLDEGVYEIAPSYLKRRYKFSRELKVHKGGSGTITRQEEESSPYEVATTDIKKRTQNLMRPGDIYLLVGPGPRNKAYLYEVIRYKPNFPRR